jgi:hypothetical protein
MEKSILGILFARAFMENDGHTCVNGHPDCSHFENGPCFAQWIEESQEHKDEYEEALEILYSEK